jgi:hypothetical protein
MYQENKKEETKIKVPFKGLRHKTDKEIIAFIGNQYKDLKLHNILDTNWRHNLKSELIINGTNGNVVIKNC